MMYKRALLFSFFQKHIDGMSYNIHGNNFCTKFKFVGALTRCPCILYCPYPFNWKICVNARRDTMKDSFILFNMETNFIEDFY